MAAVLHSAPKIAQIDGIAATLETALGDMFYHAKEEHGEIVLGVAREKIEDVLRLLRDEFEYQQLMEIAGVDFPSREERFEVVYMLLSLTRNHRIMVKCRAAENTPVPSVTTLWPVAGWLEREVFDMYGVLFEGNTDLRRILTDYGFEGHPQRKDFPLTGYQELRYSEDEKRVVYEPVELAQDFRSFDFMSPWEGAEYVLPGDEKAAENPPPPPVAVPKTTDKPSDTGAGKKADKQAAEKKTNGSPAQKRTAKDGADAPDPTESRPARKPRKGKSPDTPAATKPARSRKKPTDGGAS